MVRLWTDYVSPYAYVAKACAYALEADYRIDLEWRPYTLDIASFQGTVEARDPHHWRRVPGCVKTAGASLGRVLTNPNA